MSKPHPKQALGIFFHTGCFMFVDEGDPHLNSFVKQFGKLVSPVDDVAEWYIK